MSAEGSGRPLLPQTAQMQSFSFAQPTLAPRENQRNYVFVDEHNRHKRLKVMRACEGCRKRKIKCDAATTNSWPCAACIRLKLNCIPPTMSYDKDYTPGSHTFELAQSHEYHPAPPVTGPEDYQRHFAMQSHMAPEMQPGMPPPPPGSYPEGVRMYPAPQYMEQPPQDALSYAQVHPPAVVPPEQPQYQSQPIYNAPHPQPAQTLASSEPEGQWRNDNVSHLTEVMGELKIDHTAVPAYITNQKKFLAEAPAMEEYEPQIPQHTGPNHTVRIPTEMMPSDEAALTYFDYFFKNIHPYVPVIDRKLFYEQWHNRRDATSPLLLEAIFACATLMIGDTAQGNKWLALASKHEESFKDVPRLSTIQAMLLVLKARESAPKRGYFYRSWVTIENLVSMAKELDLHEHLGMHQMGKPCDSTPSECITKTRVWTTLFVVEMMIGAPQGRFEFGVKLDTVDFSIPRPQDDPDHQIFRQFMYFARIVKNIEYTNSMHGRMKRVKKDWMNDPEFVQHNQNYVAWLRDLPQDLQVVYPSDGSYPWISSHFVANLHCYHSLGVIMHHRPQLHFMHDQNDPYWKHHMLVCYTAAKNMCRLQEAILQQFGLQGLLSMQRGISFTIYAVLTCTMLHLVAITSPDSELNSDARDFFVRHMRILEQVTPSWPMPDMHEQVNALRTAFSADTSKPFELKPSFPYGSPPAQASASPLSNEDQYRARGPGQSPSMEQPGQVNYHAHPITPPISAHDSEPKADSPVVQSLVMMAAGGQRQPPPASMQVQEPVQWNPKGIFEHWNTAFGTPPPSTSSQSSPPLRPPPSGTAFEVRTPQESHPPGFPQLPNVNVSPHSAQVGTVQPQLPPPVSYAPTGNYVTPTMWQDVVANSFGDGGNKRRWDYGQPGMVSQEHMAKRVR